MSATDEADIDRAGMLIDRARQCRDQGRDDEAARHLLDAIELEVTKRQRATACGTLALIFMERKKSDDALVWVCRALDADPDSMPSILTFALALQRIDCHSFAITQLERLVQIDSTCVTAFVELGRSYRELGDTEKSAFHLGEGIVANPDSSRLYYELGKTYAFDGQVDRAREAFENALKATEDIEEFAGRIKRGMERLPNHG